MRVKCIDPGIYYHQIHRHKEYELLGKDYEYFYVKREDINERGGYLKERFVIVTNETEEDML